MRVFSRAIRPPDDITPNGNDLVEGAPGTVGPPTETPGDAHGVTLEGPDNPGWWPPAIRPSAWSGWPAEWSTPNWGGRFGQLMDTAWMCVDLNSSLLSTMPPYLVGAADSLSADWLNNPQPETYASWEDFAKQLFWDYQLGEVFVLATARYSTGWPARFHVVPGWLIQVEIDAGVRTYTIGDVDVTADILHIRYQSNVSDAHGHGPLEAGAGRLLAAQMLSRYATTLAASGGIPSSVLKHPDELSAEQATDLKAQWVASRMSSIGEPAVLSGGIEWEATQLDPTKMALLELSQWNESRIALLLGVPPFLVGLPSGSDAMTYKNVAMLFQYHWRGFLRPRAQTVMSALSGWLLPRGTLVEVNRDAYIQQEPLERAQTDQILHGIVDPVTGQSALTVDEIRAAERLDDTVQNVAQGVLRG